MSEILFQYHKIHPTTWVYLSSLLMIGLYFKFGRFWSVRNLDLVLLILLAPGLLMAQYGGEARLNAIRLARLNPPSREAAADPLPGAPSARGDNASPIGSESPPELPVEPLTPAAETEAYSGKGNLGNGGSAEDTSSDAPSAEVSSQPIVSEPLPKELTAGAEPAPPPTVEDPSQTHSALPEATAISRESLEHVLEYSHDIELAGFLWLFAVGVLFVIRLLLDTTMVRRPLLEPNLTSGGLLFFCCSLFLFLMANVITGKPFESHSEDVESVELIATGAANPGESAGQPVPRGPGYALLNLLPSIPTNPMVPGGVPEEHAGTAYTVVGKMIAISCHLAIVLGIIAIGYWHFGNMKTGLGVAAIYLMLPYTAQMTGQIDHVAPAALLVWAILSYRRPLAAGALIGMATALVYYPLFLLPLWIGFYWRRGVLRFTLGVVVTLVLMAILLVFIPEASYWENLKQMLGLWLPRQQNLEGLWGLNFIKPVYRIPILAAFVALSGTLALWPAQKNLGTLLSCSAALMVATQFWHGYGGGLYMCWYLPLAALAFFRPNLEDRVAVAVLRGGWTPNRDNLSTGDF